MEIKTGLVGEKIDSRDAMATDFMGVGDEIPEYFELPAPSPTHKQTHPSCVGEVESRVSEYANKKEGEDQKQSARYVYAHCKAIDGFSGQGTFLNVAIGVAKNKGISKESDYPWVADYSEYIKLPPASVDKLAEPYRIKGYVRFSNVTERNLIKRYILDYKLPVRTGSSGTNATWNKTAVKNNNYIIPEYINSSWNHAIEIVGWNKNGWILENSWDDSWGQNGRATLPYDYKGIFYWAYASYDLPNYWKEINNMWKQIDTIDGFWQILEEMGHPPINEVDKNIHMGAKTPKDFVTGFRSVFKQLREHIGEEKMQEFIDKMGW